MTTPTIRELRTRLEERRRRALGLVKALDRLGFSPAQLDAPALHSFAERDSDCLLWLARLAKLPARSPAPAGWEETTQIEQDMDRLEATITQSVPRVQRDKLAEAHEIGMVIVEDDEIYDGVPRPRRRG
jgi:hypothetical protein